MIQFNKLFTLPFNKGIYIDCSVLDLRYFKNVFIDEVIIDTQDTFLKSGPSATPVYKYKTTDNIKDLILTVSDIDLLCNLENTMFFVYVKTKGSPSIDVPCGMDNTISLGVTVDSYNIYKKALKYIKEAYNECTIPKYFIDFILRWKAFQICLKTRDYPLAITYWNKFIGSISTTKTSNCGCYG